MSDRQWYPEYQDELRANQSGLTRDEVKDRLAAGRLPIGRDEDGDTLYADKPEGMFDPETAPKLKHRWIKRGLKISCEGANHPHHQSWIRQ